VILRFAYQELLSLQRPDRAFDGAFAAPAQFGYLSDRKAALHPTVSGEKQNGKRGYLVDFQVTVASYFVNDLERFGFIQHFSIPPI
jgi:hypothetical protein